ncbi:MAG: cyclic nucleotide-binding domain-containing protein [Bacteriovorax sp.]|jgi:CRP-like cAMP-binding protein
MKKLNFIALENKIIAEITKFSPLMKFPADAPLFYEGQIPIVAYLLIDGCIHLFKKKKQKKSLKAGSLIGYSEMMNNSPSELTAQIQADSTVCFLDKSTIIEILKGDDSQLAAFLKESEKT